MNLSILSSPIYESETDKTWIFEVSILRKNEGEQVDVPSLYRVNVTDEFLYVSPSHGLPRSRLRWDDYAFDNLGDDPESAAIITALSIHLGAPSSEKISKK